MKSLDSDKKAAKPVEEAPKAEEKVDFFQRKDRANLQGNG